MFFELSKIFWTVFMPLNLICLIVLIGFLAQFRWRETGQSVMNFGLILLIFLGVVPVGPLAVNWLENQYRPAVKLPEKIDGIIVLGGMYESVNVEGQSLVSANDNIDRLYCFMDLGYRHPEAKLVFSGGAGNILKPTEKETDYVQDTLKISQFPIERMIYEDRSRNTYENALFTKELINPKFGENWVIITSAYHMPRAMGIFKKVGWPVYYYQCDPKTDSTYNIFGQLPNVAGNFAMLNIATKELIGSVVYYLTGKSAFIIPPDNSAGAPDAATSTYRPNGV